MLQDKFDAVQYKEVNDDELLEGTFSSEHTSVQKPMPRVEKLNNTGLPDYLKTGSESISDYSMDDIRIHYNSVKPVTVQALSYAQKKDIHIAPEQEQLLPHEAWHMVQQTQDRVQPTVQTHRVSVNDDEGSKMEADELERTVVDCKQNDIAKDSPDKLSKISNNTMQRKLFIGWEKITNIDFYLNKKKYFFGFIKQHLQQLIDSENRYSFSDEDKFRAYVENMEALCEYQERNSIPMEIRIGIPYRDDQFGEAILRDIFHVRKSTGIQTVPINENVLPENIHALYISGGPFSPPYSLINESDIMPNVAENEEQKRDYRIPNKNRHLSYIERHQRENELINQAIKKGLPILGMCGGSWRLAQHFGAQLMLMSDDVQRVHAKGMYSLMEHWKYHKMIVQKDSITHKMMMMGEKNETKVSSVHWLQIIFNKTSPAQISAFCENVVEAYEIIGKLGFPILGMQSHMEYSSLVPINRKSTDPMFPEHLNFMINFGRFAIYFGDRTRPIPQWLLSIVPNTEAMKDSFIQMLQKFVNLGLIKRSTVPEKIGNMLQSVVPISQNKTHKIMRNYTLTHESDVDEAIISSMVEFLNLPTLACPPPEGSKIHLVSGTDWGCYIRCVLAHFNQGEQYENVIAKVNEWNLNNNTKKQIEINLGISIGSLQETQLRRLITEIIGQQYYVEATDVQSGQKDTSAEQEGEKVSLILTGAHFSLLRK